MTEKTAAQRTEEMMDAGEFGSIQHTRMLAACHALMSNHGDVLEYVRAQIVHNINQQFFNTQPDDRDGREFLYTGSIIVNTIFAQIKNFAAEHEAKEREKRQQADEHTGKPQTY